MVSIQEFRKSQRAEGPATIMAIGTATPPNCVIQSTYPDFYFRVTKSEHKKDLQEKFRRMCKLLFIGLNTHVNQPSNFKKISFLNIIYDGFLG